MAEPVQARVAGLDALRGAALCSMVAYHLVWDLHALGWIASSPAASPGWTVFGDGVAGVFLVLSGVGLALARPRGCRFALRRLAVLVAACLAVTAASLWFAPEAPILFGILHCIAAANAVTLATLRLPLLARLGLALFAAAAPLLLRSPRFDGWAGTALGLAANGPSTLDYRPLLPWLALVHIGTAAGDLIGHLRIGPQGRGPWRRWHGRGAGGLCWLGRHSLAVYLIHQPLLYGSLALATQALTTQGSSTEVSGAPGGLSDPFMRQCLADCKATGAARRLCGPACTCTAERLALDAGSGAGSLSPRHLDDLSAACRSAGG